MSSHTRAPAQIWPSTPHYSGRWFSPLGYGLRDVVSVATHKVLRGPRCGFLLSRAEHAVAVDKAVFPFAPGRPGDECDRSQGIASADAASAEFREYARMAVDSSATVPRCRSTPARPARGPASGSGLRSPPPVD